MTSKGLYFRLITIKAWSYWIQTDLPEKQTRDIYLNKLFADDNNDHADMREKYAQLEKLLKHVVGSDDANKTDETPITKINDAKVYIYNFIDRGEFSSQV